MTTDVTATRPRGLQGVGLMLTIVVILANLGVQVLAGRSALHGLLAIVGYRLAQVVHTTVNRGSWRLPLAVAMVARVGPAVVITVTLIELYRRLSGNEAISLSYLTPVAVVAVIGMLTPWALTALPQRLGRLRRSVLLLTVAGAAAVGGLATNAVLTEASAVLVGVALGTFPLANLHRHPPTRLVWPALVGLLALLVAPPIGPAAVENGIRPALVSLAMSVLLAADIVGSLPRQVERPLAATIVRRLAGRSFGLYLWHAPFLAGLTGLGTGQWPGLSGFASTLVLSLAAATTTYRRIELPGQVIVRRLARGWVDEDVAVPSVGGNDGRPIVRWDDLRLDRLPALPLPNRQSFRRRGSGLGREPAGGEAQPVNTRVRAEPTRAGRPPKPQRPRPRTQPLPNESDQAAAS